MLLGSLVSEVQICPTFKIFLGQSAPSYLEYPGFDGRGFIIGTDILASECHWHTFPTNLVRGTIPYLDIHLLHTKGKSTLKIFSPFGNEQLHGI